MCTCACFLKDRMLSNVTPVQKQCVAKVNCTAILKRDYRHGIVFPGFKRPSDHAWVRLIWKKTNLEVNLLTSWTPHFSPDGNIPVRRLDFWLVLQPIIGLTPVGLARQKWLFSWNIFKWRIICSPCYPLDVFDNNVLGLLFFFYIP